MVLPLLVLVAVVLGVGSLLSGLRQGELRRMRKALGEREEVDRIAGPDSRLQHPVVDLSRCLGCGTCIAACPEAGVLDLVHGQAAVVNGPGCIGVSACQKSCPVGAITITLTDLDTRKDVPVLTEQLEADGTPGLFLAGEVTARSLIKTAVDHGRMVAVEVARRRRDLPDHPDGDVLDLLVVGAGPAGLSCTLQAKEEGLSVLAIEQEEELGGTVAHYPRHKLVMTEPVDMPGYGRLKRHTYQKEELMDLWRDIARDHQLPIERGVTFEGLEQDPTSGLFQIQTDRGTFRSRHVCMALGRRGVPNRLGIPGEDLSKVSYNLSDAGVFSGQRVLVVGGGDSAVEAALALSTQPGTEVRLSYRKERFVRVRSRNVQKLEAAVDAGRIQLHFETQLLRIGAGEVELGTMRDGAPEHVGALPNDHVFLMLGGTPPFALLEQSGVSFDPNRRKAAPPPGEQGLGVFPALVAGFLLAVVAVVFALWHQDYYGLAGGDQPTHPKHDLLRPGRSLGLWLGIGATALVVLNLAYLLRRAQGVRWLTWGSLQSWMTLHIATGVLALLTALLHGALAPASTPGGYAFWALVVLFLSGAVGRYFYAQIPRATNGRELELGEIRSQLDRLMEPWDAAGIRFCQKVRDRLAGELERQQWRSSFTGRVAALLGLQWRLPKLIRWMREEGRGDGLTPIQIQEAELLTRRAWRASLMVAHYEDMRAILATWRFVHRWVAALMVALIAIHVTHALAYGSILTGSGPDEAVFSLPTIQPEPPAAPPGGVR